MIFFHSRTLRVYPQGGHSRTFQLEGILFIYIIYIYDICVFPNRIENVRNQTQATAAS